MELKQLELQNFRQFYGGQQIDFSLRESNNVTVIHGDNGSGKTTLLNAFLWLFYDEVTLPQQDKIATERAMAEASPNSTVTVRITLEFDHENRQYTAERQQVFRKESPGDLAGVQIDDELSLEYIDEDGNHKRRNNPGSALKQIMPKRLREIFFFDGETINELTADDGQEKVQSAIRNIMGLEILERSIRHLETVESRFEDQIEKHGSNELAELVQRKQELQNKRDAAVDELSDLKESRREAQRDLTGVEQRLEELEESRELQERRNELEDDLDEIENDIEAINADISSTISDSGHLPFAMPAVEKTARMLQEKRQKGEIPSEVKTQFVEDLLDIQQCICGRPLDPGTEPYSEVASWRERAGSSELEEAAMKIAGRLTEIGEEQEGLYDEVETLLARRSSKRDRKRELQEELDDISTELSEKETENVAYLEERRQTLEAEVREYTEDIGDCKGDIDDLEDEIDAVKQEINDAREENELANQARRRAQTTAYLRSRIESLFSQYQNEVRESVNERVNEIFRGIIDKDYYAQISDEYALRILKDVGETEEKLVAKSTGERQVASLSFIATLISLAKERYESDEDATYFTGGIYPMLMDSPFGYLDPTYQQRVSQMLPEMAEQVIVLVTEAQWSEAVAGEMADIAGKRYELEYHDPSEEPAIDYEYTEIINKGGVS